MRTRGGKQIEWDSVKRQALWSYEELMSKLGEVLSYPFVQEHYDHTLREAQSYAKRMRSGYLQNRGDKTAYLDAVSANLKLLEAQKVRTYSDLVQQVATRERCVAFLEQSSLSFDQLIQTLNYLLRWVLPFKTPAREYLEPARKDEASHLHALRARKVSSNLDLLESGRTGAGRADVSTATGIPVAFVTSLVHRADLSRLAFVRGKTVRHLCAAGYDTLKKLAAADPADIEAKMDAYYRTLGKSSADFRSVIPLSWMFGGARILPRVVED